MNIKIGDFKMEILKAKITKDNTLVATFKNENGDTVTVEGKNLITKDLTNAFRNLVPHMTFLCEQREAYRLERMDELPDEIYNNLEVTGYSVGGSDDSEGVTLIGKRFLKSKKVLNLNSPFTMFRNENEEYTYAFELEEAIQECEFEVKQYLFEKKWAIVQQELPFSEDAPTDVAPDQVNDVSEFEQLLEDVSSKTGVSVSVDGKKIKGRHRKTRKEEIAA